ncbi:MAG: hypothetical protein IT337_17140 [Thermomicrobiales bacterium]|nr:hypothetical protein [Thermomicrobiales bacterium]
MSSLNIRVQMANGAQKAEIEVDPGVTVEEVLDAARENWALSSEYEYVVRSAGLGRQLRPADTLAAVGIAPGDTLEIQPIADAGVRS